MTEEAKEVPVFKFEENQIVRLKYSPKIHIFIVARVFDAPNAKIFYHGRIFVNGKIELNFTKFAEGELESVLTPEQEEELLRRKFPLYSVDFEDRKEDLKRILGELAGAASLAWEPKPEGVFDSTTAGKFVEEAMSKMSALFLPKEIKEQYGKPGFKVAEESLAAEDRGTVAPALERKASGSGSDFVAPAKEEPAKPVASPVELDCAFCGSSFKPTEAEKAGVKEFAKVCSTSCEKGESGETVAS